VLQKPLPQIAASENSLHILILVLAIPDAIRFCIILYVFFLQEKKPLVRIPDGAFNVLRKKRAQRQIPTIRHKDSLWTVRRAHSGTAANDTKPHEMHKAK